MVNAENKSVNKSIDFEDMLSLQIVLWSGQ